MPAGKHPQGPTPRPGCRTRSVARGPSGRAHARQGSPSKAVTGDKAGPRSRRGVRFQPARRKPQESTGQATQDATRSAGRASAPGWPSWRTGNTSRAGRWSPRAWRATPAGVCCPRRAAGCVQGRLPDDAQRGIGYAPGGWNGGRRAHSCGGGAEQLDLVADVGLGIQPGPGDPGRDGDRCEHDRLAGAVELAQGLDGKRGGHGRAAVRGTHVANRPGSGRRRPVGARCGHPTAMDGTAVARPHGAGRKPGWVPAAWRRWWDVSLVARACRRETAMMTGSPHPVMRAPWPRGREEARNRPELTCAERGNPVTVRENDQPR
jgi:hypothetical protein